MAILASAALAAGLTVLAGPTAAAARPGAARPGAGRAAAAAVPDGTITTVAGGVAGPAAATSVNLGVSTPIAGTTSSPCGVSFTQGQLLVADDWTVRSIDPASGALATPAGTAASGPFSDGGPATGTPVDTCAVTADAAGNLVIADVANDRIRVVAASTGTFYGQDMTAGDMYTVAGTGSYGDSGDGGPATSAQLSDPVGVTADAAGNLVIAGTFGNRIRVVAAASGTFYGQAMTAGDIYTIAGTGTTGYTGDGGPATSAPLHYPQGVAVDGSGDVLVTDSGNNRLRMIAGSGPAPAAGPGGRPPGTAPFLRPRAVAGAGRAAPRAAAARRHAPAGHADPATAGPFVTLLFSRSEIGAADNCVPDDSGIAPLETVVAPYLQSLGMTGTGTLVSGVTQATVPTCTHGSDSLSASWADAASLTHNFGWSFVSHTATYPSQLGKLTPTQSYAETCGSTAALDGHGLPGGHGLIAYPGVQAPPLALQAGYGANCFAWGRTYNKPGITPAANATTPPYWQDTLAVNGGACHVWGAPCYTVTSGVNSHARYDLPSTIIAEIHSLQPGQWFTLQAYVLVTGSSPAYSHNATRWDCSSPDPALHWTNDNERYCYSDWQQIVSAIAAMPSVTVADPLTVGVAFGRPAGYP